MKAAWAREWARAPAPAPALAPAPDLDIDLDTKAAVLRDWKVRWEVSTAQDNRRRPGRLLQVADAPTFDGSALDLHRGLRKAESSILVQIRTGKLGLRAFLHHRQVPGIDNPNCPHCLKPETAFHVITDCRAEDDRRETLTRALGEDPYWWDRARLQEALQDPSQAILIARWLIGTGRLPEYRLATEYETKEREKAWRIGAEAS